MGDDQLLVVEVWNQDDVHGLAHNSMRRYSGTEGETATEILRQRELARDRERNADARNGWESGPYFV